MKQRGMRRATVLVVLVLGVAAMDCGSSSSESPWPVEPLDTEPGPVGERPADGAREATTGSGGASAATDATIASDGAGGGMVDSAPSERPTPAKPHEP